MKHQKNNDTFGIEDEWYLKFGPQITSEDAAKITPLQWRLTKQEIQKARKAYDDKAGIYRYEEAHTYKGMLWFYQEVIKHFKLSPGEKQTTPAPKSSPRKIPKLAEKTNHQT